MNSKWMLVCFFMAFVVYEAAGQINCYSCSSNLGSSYGRRNYDCISNLTNIRTIRCSRGYYCLTSYTVGDGIVTSLRRSCQNPRSDHNQNTDDAPTEDGCVSTHSRYSSTSVSATCYFHCTSTRCNKNIPVTVKKCPDQCPNDCDLTTNQCRSTLKCVQCTSDNDKDCESKTDAIECPRSTYNYCAATRTSVLNLNQQVVSHSVTKSCTRFSSSYDIPDQPCSFRSSSRRSSNNQLKYTCSSFCSESGCNVKIPGGTAVKNPGSSLRCVVCSQIGSSGSCSRSSRTRHCPVGSTHCKATVTYYLSPEQDRFGNPNYQLASIERECATEVVKTQCTSQNIANTNLQFFTCQETCQSNGCNSGWPARPKCSQCSATNRSYSRPQFARCLSNPYAPSQCSSPLYQYCTTITNNTAAHSSFAQTVRRSCSITDIGTNCFNEPVNGGETIRHCQSACTTSNCNNKAQS